MLNRVQRGRLLRTSALTIAAAVLLPVMPASAALITDPAGDFLPTYTGPKNGDLDVVSAQVFYDGLNFTFTSTQNGPVGTTPTGIYVWGIDRGSGTPGFPVIAPGVTFDAIFLINPSGASTLRDQRSGIATPITNISVSGATVTGVVSAGLLPSQGLAPSAFLVNLWPRSGAAGDSAISDFAPDNSVVRVTNVATPEPSTISLVMGASLLGMSLLRKRKREQV